jgi:hypothetical protein
MLGSYFYNERIRKSVAMFGSLFNNIYVIRKNAAGSVISTVKVPISYAPKRDFLERIRESADLDNDQNVAIKLPRMSFEILGFSYNPIRQLNKMGNVNRVATTSATPEVNRSKIYNYVPYDINFQLQIYAKTQDDALQIVEQILPFFAPQYSLTIKPFSDYADIKEDVPITLDGLSISDDFEGELGNRRTIIYALDFLMQANFYQGINESAIIRKVINNVHVDTLIDSDGHGTASVPTLKLTVDPNPLNVSPDSDYGFTTTILEAEDGDSSG